MERALLAELWGKAHGAPAPSMAGSSCHGQTHSIFICSIFPPERNDTITYNIAKAWCSFKYLKAAERTHWKIKKMKHSYQDTTMTLCIKEENLLCGYDQTVCWVLRNNFLLTAYKSILIRLCCQGIYYFRNIQVHVNKDKDISMHTCNLYCHKLIQQDVG